MDVTIATWNIYWLGAWSDEFPTRSDEDEARIADVIRQASPDVLALQEIVDPELMERIVERASGTERRYVLRYGTDDWFTSDDAPTSKAQERQKVFLCVDDRTLEVTRVASLASPGRRKPVAVALRHRETGAEFTVVTLHLKAGWPDFYDEKSASERRAEARSLVRWLLGAAQEENPVFPRPTHDRVVVLGDFNAELNLPGAEKRDPNDSLAPLFDLTWQASWHVADPAPDGAHAITSLYPGDYYVIDLMLLSPAMREAMRQSQMPTVYAWDFDERLGGPAAFHEGADGSGKLRSFGVSDHRMVRARASL